MCDSKEAQRLSSRQERLQFVNSNAEVMFAVKNQMNTREEKQLVFTGNRKLETSVSLRSSFHCVSEQLGVI